MRRRPTSGGKRAKDDGVVKEVLAVVRPFRAIEVLREIAKFDVESLRVAEARGYGRQKDQLDLYQGSEFSAVYLPKIEVRFVARDDLVETIVARIISAARTGRIGDGKIHVMPVEGSVEF